MIRRYRYLYKGNKDDFDKQLELSTDRARKSKSGLLPIYKNYPQETKGKAFELRRSGKSYNAISKELSVPKSTLSLWFRKSGENFDEIKRTSIQNGQTAAKERLFEFTNKRKAELFRDYDEAIKEAGEEFERYKNEPLFIAGLMLYAGEGDMASRCHIRLSNGDWRLHDVFIRFLEKYLLFTRQKVRMQILGHIGDGSEVLIGYWGEKLLLSKDQFHKTQIIKGKSRKKLQFGVGMSIINNTRAKYKLREWIDLRIKEIQNAGMV